MVPGGPADQAGIAAGDVICELGGIDVSTFKHRQFLKTVCPRWHWHACYQSLTHPLSISLHPPPERHACCHSRAEFRAQPSADRRSAHPWWGSTKHACMQGVWNLHTLLDPTLSHGPRERNLHDAR